MTDTERQVTLPCDSPSINRAPFPAFLQATRIAAIITMVLFICTEGVVKADLVIADFNDNTPASNLGGQTGGSGWGANAWSPAGGNPITVQSGGDLATGDYLIAQNPPGQIIRQDDAIATFKTRTFGANMTGDVWFSFLVNHEFLAGGFSSQSAVTFNNADLEDAVFFSGLDLNVRRNGAQTQFTNVLGNGDTSFVLGHLGMNDNGTNDLLEIWIDPDLSDFDNETPLFSMNDVGFVPNTFFGIGVTSYYDPLGGLGTPVGGQLDSIRFSDTETAFFDVTGSGGSASSPEPASVFLLLVGLVFLSGRWPGRR